MSDTRRFLCPVDAERPDTWAIFGTSVAVSFDPLDGQLGRLWRVPGDPRGYVQWGGGTSATKFAIPVALTPLPAFPSRQELS